MYPILFKLPVPDFLESIFGTYFTVYSYGFFIVLGAIAGVTYTSYQAERKFALPFDKINSLFLLLLLAAFVGGKVFLYLENPSRYANNFKGLLTGKGFVFYGSLLFCIPAMLVFFKRNKLPVYEMLDIMAVTTCIVHIFGRLGCFMAGCCYGIEWHGPIAVTFSDPVCLARPLDQPLHPTQLYGASMIISILLVLLLVKNYQKFHGQLFLTYLLMYATGRSIIEVFRGDVSRGFIIEDYLSHSQFISLIVFSVTAYYYFRLYKKSRRIRTE
ncbi:prolipoprotein diacylglyceryl transferase [Fulvivirga sp. M361]|uniref:prolipoprotein diacylglyceryl transferase n=1 Tax=Fulvivirga sp. M361 TaxID=2594266 RepID=UPI00117AA472|nr:prolipoprotein diacylglyceryl transferase family protein [Fulvivirga sp. M361]TRX60813.1 prolipoprotein diacylglyceryl transferase [Fulvivirga sp. M361]